MIKITQNAIIQKIIAFLFLAHLSIYAGFLIVKVTNSEQPFAYSFKANRGAYSI